jgi:hypothetical protein
MLAARRPKARVLPGSLAEIVLASRSPRPLRGQGHPDGCAVHAIAVATTIARTIGNTVPFGGISGRVPGSFPSHREPLWV